MQLMKLNIYEAEYSVEYKVIGDQGETWHDKQVIYLNKDNPLAYQKRTLVHEILHITMTQVGTYNAEAIKEVSSKDLADHLMIDPVANGLFDVLKDNPHLRKWLFDE